MLMVVFIFELKAELPTRSQCLGARETSVTSVAEDGKGQPTNRLRYTIARRSRRLCYSARIKQVNFKAVAFIWKKAIITIYFLNILYRILMCIGEPEFDPDCLLLSTLDSNQFLLIFRWIFSGGKNRQYYWDYVDKY